MSHKNNIINKLTISLSFWFCLLIKRNKKKTLNEQVFNENITNCLQKRTANYLLKHVYPLNVFFSMLEILHFEHESLTLREGKPAWFKVKVQSNTLCNVKWFHDGNLITSSSTRFTMTSIRKDNDTSSHTLHIASVLPRDRGKLQGTFRCTANFFYKLLVH